ncbi:MAG: hypothetical protein QM736_25870 [Vicinamibacterales bacterium]
MTPASPSSHSTGLPLRVLAVLLIVWEPVSFAAVAASAFNAIGVRGWPVALVLTVRLIAAAVGVAAGRAILDHRPGALTLVRLALVSSALVRLVSDLTPWFPSNRMPGDTPIYVGWTLLYYGGWLLYVSRSRQVQALEN